MSLQGPLVVVADNPAGEVVAALAAAGAFPVVESRWAKAANALASIKPSAVILADTDGPAKHLTGLQELIARAAPFLPVIARVGRDAPAPFPTALPVAVDMPVERLVVTVAVALRSRALHATVLGRAQRLKEERNIIAELPAGDPLEDATVLVVGRGRSHPTLSVAVGERVGVMGALSVELAARCLAAREIDGVIVGEGLPARSVDSFLQALANDARLRDVPVGILGGDGDVVELPTFLRAPSPQVLVERLLPFIRLHALEGRLHRLLTSIQCKGMIDARTGLLTTQAFGAELSRMVEDAAERGVGLSVARFSFDAAIDLRVSMDAARLMSRLIRKIDFACRQDDGSVVVVFTETDLRAAHVVARRLASVLKHTMLRPRGEQRPLDPAVTLATLKPTDSVLTLLARVASRGPVAAE